MKRQKAGFGLGNEVQVPVSQWGWSEISSEEAPGMHLSTTVAALGKMRQDSLDDSAFDGPPSSHAESAASL